MAQVLPLLLGSLGVGAGAAAGAASVAGTLGTVFGALSSMSSAAYNRQVSLNNAAVAEQNAQQATFKAQQDAQDLDFAAQGQIGQLLSASGASGLSLGSGSIVGEQRSLHKLAAQDRARVIMQGQASAANFRRLGQDFRAQAGLDSMDMLGPLVTGYIGLKKSTISGAPRVARRTAGRINRTGVDK